MAAEIIKVEIDVSDSGGVPEASYRLFKKVPEVGWTFVAQAGEPLDPTGFEAVLLADLDTRFPDNAGAP